MPRRRRAAALVLLLGAVATAGAQPTPRPTTRCAANDFQKHVLADPFRTGGGCEEKCVTSVATGDFRGEGAQDVVAAGWHGGEVKYFANTDAVFDEVASVESTLPLHVVVADLDDDGSLDFLVAHGITGGYYVGWHANAAGSLSFEEQYVYAADSDRTPDAVSVADVDGDADLDVLVA